MENLVTFDNVSKKFKGKSALQQLSFAVPEGVVFGLLGPNGAGKTTAIRILLGLAKANSGTAELFGTHAGKDTFPAALRQTGTLVETPALYQNASARANMEIQAAAFGVSRKDPRIAELLELVGLADRAGDRVKTFSLGMRQRLALALALFLKPQLVVLDEPTNGLDPAGIVEIRELIRTLPQHGTTVLVSSHLLDEVEKMCDQVAIINAGSVIEEGTIDQVLAKNQTDSRFVISFDQELHQQAASVLENLQVSWQTLSPGSVAVVAEHVTGAHISKPLAEAGVYVDELRQEQRNLEQIFLSLTQSVVEHPEEGKGSHR